MFLLGPRPPPGKKKAGRQRPYIQIQHNPPKEAGPACGQAGRSARRLFRGESIPPGGPPGPPGGDGGFSIIQTPRYSTTPRPSNVTGGLLLHLGFNHWFYLLLSADLPSLGQGRLKLTFVPVSRNTLAPGPLGVGTR